MTLLANLTSTVIAGMLGNPIRSRLPISMLVFPSSLLDGHLPSGAAALCGSRPSAWRRGPQQSPKDSDSDSAEPPARLRGAGPPAPRRPPDPARRLRTPRKKSRRTPAGPNPDRLRPGQGWAGVLPSAWLSAKGPAQAQAAPEVLAGPARGSRARQGRF